MIMPKAPEPFSRNVPYVRHLEWSIAMVLHPAGRGIRGSLWECTVPIIDAGYV